jgi:hypothetical protein
MKLLANGSGDQGLPKQVTKGPQTGANNYENKAEIRLADNKAILADNKTASKQQLGD